MGRHIFVGMFVIMLLAACGSSTPESQSLCGNAPAFTIAGASPNQFTITRVPAEPNESLITATVRNIQPCPVSGQSCTLLTLFILTSEPVGSNASRAQPNTEIVARGDAGLAIVTGDTIHANVSYFGDECGGSWVLGNIERI